jgi:hypothetical protein
MTRNNVNNVISSRLSACCAKCGAQAELPSSGLRDFLSSEGDAPQVSTPLPCEQCGCSTIVLRELNAPREASLTIVRRKIRRKAALISGSIVLGWILIWTIGFPTSTFGILGFLLLGGVLPSLFHSRILAAPIHSLNSR